MNGRTLVLALSLFSSAAWATESPGEMSALWPLEPANFVAVRTSTGIALNLALTADSTIRFATEPFLNYEDGDVIMTLPDGTVTPVGIVIGSDTNVAQDGNWNGLPTPITLCRSGASRSGMNRAPCSVELMMHHPVNAEHIYGLRVTVLMGNARISLNVPGELLEDSTTLP